MSSIKLNSKRSETKSDHIKRINALDQTLSRDNSLLKPATDLSDFAKNLFYTIKKENKQLSNSDNYMLNLLCSEYDIYLKMSQYVTKHGVIDDKGKQSGEYMVLKSTINQILKISSSLQITPKNRISSDYHNQEKSDPVREVFAK